MAGLINLVNRKYLGKFGSAIGTPPADVSGQESEKETRLFWRVGACFGVSTTDVWEVQGKRLPWAGYTAMSASDSSCLALHAGNYVLILVYLKEKK